MGVSSPRGGGGRGGGEGCGKRRRGELEQVAQEPKLTRADLSRGINVLNSDPHYRAGGGGMQAMDKSSKKLWGEFRLQSSKDKQSDT